MRDVRASGHKQVSVRLYRQAVKRVAPRGDFCFPFVEWKGKAHTVCVRASKGELLGKEVVFVFLTTGKKKALCGWSLRLARLEAFARWSWITHAARQA
jgi:hypothetical protein